MAEKNYKRKNYLIDRRMQFQLIGVFLFSVVLALAIITLGSALVYWASGMTGENLFKEYLTIHRQVSVEVESVVEGEVITQEITQTQEIPGVKRWEIIIPVLIINNLIIMVIIVIFGIFYSHRIAGPLYRIQTDIEKVLDGSKDVRINLRKRDKMKPLANLLNHMIEELNTLRNKRS